MNINSSLRLLESLQAQDEEFFAEKLQTTAATFCASCRANKPVSLHPFWHRFGRTLCDECRIDYGNLLRSIGAFDKLG